MTGNTTADPTTRPAVHPADGTASRRTVSATGPFRVPLLLVGLALLASFGALSVLASYLSYLPSDVAVERWLQA